MNHLVSILVRSKNDEKFVEATLRAIFDQECETPFVVVCCDDGSSDRTPQILAAFPKVLLLPCPPGEYYPGRRLNYMVAHSHGDLIVFNNADAIPQNRHWLQALIAPLLAGTADAAYGNQLPRPDAQFLVRKDHRRAFGDGKTSAKWHFFFSLATSAAWRKDLLDNPFDEQLRYSEDVEWAHRRSLRIAYVPEAQVQHSHNYTLAELRRRFFGEGQADAQIFGPTPLWRELAGATMETLRDFAFLLPRPAGWKELPIAPLRRWTQRYYHWKGGHADDRA